MAGWAVGSDIEALWSQAGLTLPSGVDTDALVTQAVQYFVRSVGHGPFYAQGADVGIRLDPPGPRPSSRAPSRRGGGTLLRIPSMAVLTSVKVDHEGGSTGDLLEMWTDYVLEPEEARQGRGPYTRLRFNRTVYGNPGSILLTGKPGYTTDITEEINRGILEGAVATLARQVLQGLAAGVVEWKDGDESERYSIELLGQLGTSWQARFDEMVMTFRRMD